MKTLMHTLSVLSLLLVSMPVLAEKETVDVLAPLDVAGVVYRIGPDKVLIQGTTQGILYVQNAKGSMDAMLMRCPTRNMVDMKTGNTDASGYCLISDGGEDNLIFAEMNCKGQSPQSCKGDFQINGGNGKFKGITGSGALRIRAALSEVVANEQTGNVIKETKGLAVISKLKYSIPAK
jgi:hypothetical protein